MKLLGWGMPAAAGAVAAVMILSPIAPRNEISFLLDRNKVAVTEERLRVNDAIYRGTDASDRPFSLVAQSAFHIASRSGHGFKYGVPGNSASLFR